MGSNYDVIVAGGSVGGLSYAIAAASRGLDVLVLEEDKELGEPEKCDGLVSQQALGRYIAPEKDCIQSHVKRGVIHSPSGRSASLDASRLSVVVLDRSAYEQQLASKAISSGAEVKLGARVMGATERPDGVKVSADDQYTCSYYVDATGPSSVVGRNRSGLIPAAKYEVEGDWFKEGQVEVFIDQTKYPGFFAWIIPRGDGLAKVGAAGIGINSFKTLDSFLEGKRFTIRSRVAAPIYVGGPFGDFVSGRMIYVGESAGQVKPTTAGGILSSVSAGLMAGRWTAESVHEKKPSLIRNYQKEWEERFGVEFRLMRRFRNLFEHLSNEDVEKIVGALSTPKVSEKLASTDFDFHASALLSAMGVRMTVQLASLLISVEARQALSSLVQT